MASFVYYVNAIIFALILASRIAALQNDRSLLARRDAHVSNKDHVLIKRNFSSAITPTSTKKIETTKKLLKSLPVTISVKTSAKTIKQLAVSTRNSNHKNINLIFDLLKKDQGK